MKVLHIINSLHTGGAEKLLITTIPLLIEKGIQVDVALLTDKGSLFYDNLKRIPNLKIYRLSKGSVYNPFLIFRIIPLLKNYHIIHGHLFPVQYFLVLAKLFSFSKVKLVFTEHSTSNTRIRNSVFWIIEKFMDHFYNIIICVSEQVRQVLFQKININSKKLVTIPNGINLSEIRAKIGYERSKFGFNGSDKILIMVAGFKKPKNHKLLILALKELPSNYKLVLVGDGNLMQETKNLVEIEGLQSKVHFLGNRADVINIIKMCDISVLSSDYEGLPLSIIESMASGLPTIGSDVEGINNVLLDPRLLFDNESKSDLVNKIRQFEDVDYYEKMSEICVKRSEDFNIDKSIERICKVYGNILGS